MKNKLNIQSIFTSIDGEANGFNGAGELSTFIRLKGCNLRCQWCDTTYAQESKPENWMTIKEILKKIPKGIKKITLTGGEVLMQKEELIFLIEELRKEEKIISIETNGSIPIPFSELGWLCILYEEKNVRWIVDWKLPSSGTEKYMNLDVFRSLRDIDVIKFVIADKKDYKRACELTQKNPSWVAKKVFSPMMKPSRYKYMLYSDYTQECSSIAFDMKWPQQLVEMMLKDRVPAQFSLQIHKILWAGAKEER